MCIIYGCAYVVFVNILLHNVESKVFDSDFEKDIDLFVKATMDCRHLPGLTIAVVKENETWTKGYGYADLPKGSKVTKRTLFNIGSVTKSFTMVLLGKLLSERSLTWTSKVKDICGPGYEFIDEYRTSETTLKDLLSHRTGLSRLDIGLLAGFPDNTTREHLTKKLKYLPEEKPFRDSFIYNNFLFMYLGHICEILGKDSWENLLKKHVLDPIGMTSTILLKTPADVQKEGVAKPYIFKDNKFQPGTKQLYSLSPVEPAGAILSNGEDMAKYMRFLMNKGKTTDGKVLVDEGLILAAFKSTTTISTDAFLKAELLTLPQWPVGVTPRGYGHALFVATYRGFKKIYHTGGLFSYITRMFTFPDKNIGVFVSTNGPGFRNYATFATKSVANFVSDEALGLDPWLNATTTCTYPEPWSPEDETKPSNDSSPHKALFDLSEYAGTYQQEILPSMSILSHSADNTTLHWTMNRISGVLHTTEVKDAFKMEILEPWEIMTSLSDNNNDTIKYNVTFERNLNGVSGMIVAYDVNITYTRN